MINGGSVDRVGPGDLGCTAWQARLKERGLTDGLFSCSCLKGAQLEASGEGLDPIQHNPLQERPKAAAGGPCQLTVPRHQGLCDYPCGYSQVMATRNLGRILSICSFLPYKSQESQVSPATVFALHKLRQGPSQHIDGDAGLSDPSPSEQVADIRAKGPSNSRHLSAGRGACPSFSRSLAQSSASTAQVTHRFLPFYHLFKCPGHIWTQEFSKPKHPHYRGAFLRP